MSGAEQAFGGKISPLAGAFVEMTRRERIATGGGSKPPPYALAMTEEGTIPSEPNGVTIPVRVGNASTPAACRLAMTEEGTIPSEPNGVTMIARVGNASTLGAMGAPPVAEASDLSEWPRSADEEAAPSVTKMPGTATAGTPVGFLWDTFQKTAEKPSKIKGFLA